MSLTFSQIQQLWLALDREGEFSQLLYVDVKQQTLKFFNAGSLFKSYVISTAKNGVGNQQGSFQTPLGFHAIGQKIGADQPINMLFKARKATGEIAKINDNEYTQNDSITSRILWLTGLQQSFNLDGLVDTKQRYIYIHGTADEAHLGQAVSHGCIRMKNSDIIELFQQVDNRTIVYIA